MVTTTWTQTAGMTSETNTDNIEDYAEQAEASKNAAAASETAAASSASAAAGSATAAQTAKTAAELAETNAETAETNAANSATTAASQASIATTKASEASASESAAAASASAAAASEAGADADRVAAQAAASAASTSQTNAATSATNAATSETNAANSATASASSATASANSASAASASETAAATSETNAATSETNAATSETNAATSAAASASSATAAASSASSASTSATSASNAQTAAESARDATLAAYDNFDDRYLGSKASDPTVDNDGNPLVAGSIYFNSVSGAMRVYTGSAWVAAYVNGADYLALSGGTMTGDVAYGDNVKATFGNSADLEVYHDGSNSLIQDLGTGILQISSDGTEVKISGNGTNCARFFTNGESQLFTNGNLKLATKNTGIDVTGTVTMDGGSTSADFTFGDNDKAIFGNSSDLQIYHRGDASFIDDVGTGNLNIRAENLNLANSDGSENYIRMNHNGSVDIYYDNSKKLETSSTGSSVYGSLLAYASSSNDWALRGYNSATSALSGLWFANDSAQFLGRNSSNTLTVNINSNGSSYFNGGNVGIGTQSPAEELTIRASVPKIQIEDSDGTNQYGQFYHSAGITAIQARNGNTDGTIVFQKYDGTTNDETVRIDSGGNLEMTGGGSVGWANFTFKEESGYLYVYNGSTKIMRVDASGNAAFAGDVEANATL